MAISFERLYEAALRHRGGDFEQLESLLTTAADPKALAAIPDARWLSAASKAVFSAGFNWSVVAKKWPAHEEAFANFDPNVLVGWPDDRLDELVSDPSIIRHGAKIRSVFENARFFHDLSREHGSVGAYMAASPPDKYVDLLATLKKRGSRLGGTSGQYFLRSMGVPSLILTRDVVRALIQEGVVDKEPTSKLALAKVQDAANQLMAQSGRDLTTVSRVLALSVG